MGEYLSSLMEGSTMSGRFPLNEIFSYQYELKSKRLFLHLNTSSVKNLNPVKINNFFKDAFQQLRLKLKTDKHLESLETIIVRSWIVRDHPKILTRFGLVVDPKASDWATISIQDYLKLSQLK